MIDSIGPEEWARSIYSGWLYALKALLEEPGEGYPTFMRTEAWLDKSLNTALASWAQLRHDTILYAKQPYAELSAVLTSSRATGYVEPNPLLYSGLKNLVDATRTGLGRLGLLDAKLNSSLATFSRLLEKLVDISVKELRERSSTPRRGIL